jgi:uncharacterized protein (DUF2147 family)
MRARLLPTMLGIPVLGALAAMALAAPAMAAGAEGVWMRSDGMAKVQFAPCGGGQCGTIVWLKDPANSQGKIGEQVFFGMGQTGPNSWSGQAHNPEDGRDYDGTMTLSGNRLTTKGCALGGMICKTVTWSRSH